MNERVMELYRHPSHKGALPASEAGEGRTVAQAQGENPLCGDSLTVQIALEQEGAADADDTKKAQVAAMAWDGYACSLCCASAEALSRAVAGRTVESCLALDVDDLPHLIGTDKPGRTRTACMELPLSALKEALSNYGNQASS